MNHHLYLLGALTVMTVVTAVTRFLPFAVFRNTDNQKSTKYLDYLGEVLPPALMAMLVVYSLRLIDVTHLEGWVPALIASVVTLGIFAWRRSMLLAILGGTVLYMVLVQAVF